jgi:hypothetical protein
MRACNWVPGPIGRRGLAGLRRIRRRFRPGKGWSSSRCSPRSLWWTKLGRRGHRRGRVAALRFGGRGGSAPATKIARPGQDVAWVGLGDGGEAPRGFARYWK